MNYDEAVAYVKGVLDNWTAWKEHHQGLTEALEIIIKHLEAEETASEPKEHTT